MGHSPIKNIKEKKMRKTKIAAIILLIVMIIPVVVFANGQTEKSSAGDGVFIIGMSQSDLGAPWRVQMNADIKAEADKHENIKVIYKDAQNDTLKQRSQVEEFINAGVDLLIISPKEAQPLTDPIAKVMAAGIPVIILDRKIMGNNYTQFIGADNVLIGNAVGEWVVENFSGKGAKVVELMGLQTTTPGQDRHSGFRDSIKGSDIEVIFQADVKWHESLARKEMESALSRFDKIDLVYGHNDRACHGAYLAAKAAGRENEMMFVGIDGLPQEGIAYVRDGILDATFEYPSGGDIAIQQALLILDGKPVEKNITLGSRIFTRENVDSGGVPLK